MWQLASTKRMLSVTPFVCSVFLTFYRTRNEKKNDPDWCFRVWGNKMFDILKMFTLSLSPFNDFPENKALVRLKSCNNVHTEKKIFEYSNLPRLLIKRPGRSNWSVVCPAGLFSWSVKLVRSCWSLQLVHPAGLPSWSVQLVCPAGP